MMNEIETLVEMQKRDDEITRLQVLIKKLPEQLQQLKSNVKDAQQTMLNLKEELEKNRKEQDQRELSIKSNKDQSAKYQNQLLTVQTNKEYKALNKEVSHLEETNSQLEDEIMELMEAAEELREQQRTAKGDLAAAEKELERNEKRLENEIKEVEHDMDKYRAERKELAKVLPISIVKKYAALIKNRDRRAVVFNIGDSCGGCGFKIRPQVMVELHSRDKIIYCESCSRIIVLNPEN